MNSINIKTLFQGQEKLIDTLYQFCNIPHIPLRNDLLKNFCHHDQVKPILERNGLLPDYFYFVIISMLQ